MILVTGGTGLAGSHLLLELTSQGKRVRALRRKSSNNDFLYHVFNAYAGDPEGQLELIEWAEGDILDIFSLNDAMDGVDKVYHNAGLVSFDPSERDLMYRINVEGTANVVNAALEKGIDKLCYISSIATLGRAKQDGITDESTAWVTSRYNSHYAISKYNAEREVWRGTAEGLDAVVILPSIIIGLADLNNGSMQLFKTVKLGIPFYTPGSNGYIDARDLARAQVFLMDSDIVNERFILSAENLGYKEVLGMIAEGLGKRKPFIRVNNTMALIARYFFKAKSLITGQAPIITKETARTAMRKYSYSGDKFLATGNMEFTPVKETIKTVCSLYRKHDFFTK